MMNSTIPSTILEQGTEFLAAIVEWACNLPSMAWSDLAQEAAQGRVALFSVAMINGFCHEGVLSSPRVQDIIPAVVDAFKGAYAIGVRLERFVNVAPKIRVPRPLIRQAI